MIGLPKKYNTKELDWQQTNHLELDLKQIKVVAVLQTTRLFLFAWSYLNLHLNYYLYSTDFVWHSDSIIVKEEVLHTTLTLQKSTIAHQITFRFI